MGFSVQMADADPGTPDIRGPWRYLLWMAVRHWRVLVPDCVFNVLWAGTLGLIPYVIGEAVNAGLIARDQAALIWWGLAALGLGVIQALSALMVERLETRARLEPGYQTMRFVTRKACELGVTVSRRVSAGDLVTVGVSVGGWQTNTCVASATGSSGSRIRASASATVA